MSHRSIEEYLGKSGGSVYRLIRMAANRALELSEGKPRLIQTNIPIDKYTTIALEEIAQGKVDYKNGKSHAGESKKEAEDKKS